MLPMSAVEIDGMGFTTTSTLVTRGTIYRTREEDDEQGGTQQTRTLVASNVSLSIQALGALRSQQGQRMSDIERWQATFAAGTDIRAEDEIEINGSVWEVDKVVGGGTWETSRVVDVRRIR